MKINLITLLLAALTLQGCVLTKVVTVPMRIGGAIISVVPVVGDPIDESIDTVADGIDKIPIYDLGRRKKDPWQPTNQQVWEDWLRLE